MEKKLYLTKKETAILWNYIGDPTNPNTTLDTGMVEVTDRNEIRVDDHGAYVIRIVK